MDSRPEYTSKAVLCWTQQRGVKLHFVQPGEPTQNAFVESFNGKFRDECLNQHSSIPQWVAESTKRCLSGYEIAPYCHL